MNNKKILKIVIPIVLLVVLCIAIITIVFYHPEPKPSLEPDSNASEWEGQQELDKPKTDVKQIAIPGLESLVFKEGQKEQRVNFYNPKENDCLIVFSLHIDDRELWRSGYCAPDKGYYDIELSEPLEKGTRRNALEFRKCPIYAICSIGESIMKKLLSILCAAVMLVSPYNVYATEVLGDGSATTTITAHVDSQYCVMIPETIVADGILYYFTSSMMDLAQGEVVDIVLTGLQDGRIPMSGGNEGAYATIETDQMVDANNPYIVGRFHSGETTTITGIRAYLVDAYKAGDYSGTVTFDIRLAQE